MRCTKKPKAVTCVDWYSPEAVRTAFGLICCVKNRDYEYADEMINKSRGFFKKHIDKHLYV